MRDDIRQMKVVFVQVPLPADVRDKFKDYATKHGYRGMVDCLTKFIHDCVKESEKNVQGD